MGNMNRIKALLTITFSLIVLFALSGCTQPADDDNPAIIDLGETTVDQALEDEFFPDLEPFTFEEQQGPAVILKSIEYVSFLSEETDAMFSVEKFCDEYDAIDYPGERQVVCNVTLLNTSEEAINIAVDFYLKDISRDCAVACKDTGTLYFDRKVYPLQPGEDYEGVLYCTPEEQVPVDAVLYATYSGTERMSKCA